MTPRPPSLVELGMPLSCAPSVHGTSQRALELNASAKQEVAGCEDG
eukprot:CAMPEP_0194520032 /NCGR_PEP_ID=MMETSP0253-20130528/53895_1 /TAXON_ID=2966 /ORGANISM="Noctiluca scintillans" /LENGTH=45 /DNA_ID= /DNA_START= /DNA_END= /DNA_ORIENTATION=